MLSPLYWCENPARGVAFAAAIVKAEAAIKASSLDMIVMFFRREIFN